MTSSAATTTRHISFLKAGRSRADPVSRVICPHFRIEGELIRTVTVAANRAYPPASATCSQTSANGAVTTRCATRRMGSAQRETTRGGHRGARCGQRPPPLV